MTASDDSKTEEHAMTELRPSTPNHDLVSLAKGLTHVVNSGGLAFQYSAINVTKEQFENKKSEWIFEASEFPVQAGGVNSAVDFVLRHRQYPIFLLIECKRVNPAFGQWVFLRTEFLARSFDDDVFVAEHVFDSDNVGKLAASGIALHNIKGNRSNVALAIKSNNIQGDSAPQGDGKDIDSVFKQINLGLNGFVNHVINRSSRTTGDRFPIPALFIPVILTTASLYRCTASLESADISGHFEIKPEQLTRADWIYHQLNLSALFRHENRDSLTSRFLHQDLIRDFVRTVPIVSASSFALFLTSFNSQLLSAKELEFGAEF